MAKRAMAAGGSITTTTTPAPGGGWIITDETLNPQQWAWLRKQFLIRAKWVAQMIGIEELGWYDQWKKPAASPSLLELGTLYADKPNLTDNERSRSRLFWGEFTKAVQVRTANDLDHEAVARYEKWLRGQNLAAKSVKHRVAKVRTVLGYALKRGRDVRKALDACAMLEIPRSNSLDPRPIPSAEFWAVHKVARKAGDEQFCTIMVLALNLALYPSEVAVVKWDEINMERGEFISRRRKTSVPRVGVLWPETIKALRKLPKRESGYLFHSDRVLFSANLVGKYWREYREAARVPESTTFAGIRDGAFTIACRETTLDAARVLAGHRAGQADHYVLRQPQIVDGACQAIRREYAVAANMK